MTFLLDHCTWKETENILKDEGFSCTTLRELGKNEAANGEVIALANSRKAILVTRDRDFANLTLYPMGNHQGIIFLQITPQSIEKVHKVLLETLRTIPAEHIKGNLLVIPSTTSGLHKAK